MKCPFYVLLAKKEPEYPNDCCVLTASRHRNNLRFVARLAHIKPTFILLHNYENVFRF